MAGDHHLRAALFRLVDVAPACATPKELVAHLDGFLHGPSSAGSTSATLRHALRSPTVDVLLGRMLSAAVSAMARRFIVGHSIADALPQFERLWRNGTAVTVDLLGEATVTFAEGQAYAERCEHALLTLSAAAAQWPERTLLEHDAAGPLPRVNLSVKLTALTPLVRAEAPERGRADASRHLVRLLRRARDLDAHLHIDMESFDGLEMTLSVMLDLLSEREFGDGPSAGIVLQAYLRESEQALTRILTWARSVQRGQPLTIRLVKGAYWDHEVILARQHGWTPPVWTDKVETDRCFERLAARLIDAYPIVRPAIASHNLRSLAHTIAYARRRGLRPADVELQVLRGLGDDLQANLARNGFRCRTYCPVGDLVEGMSYLVRRLLENTANESFLMNQPQGTSILHLLEAP